ncbi:MAG: hypothetical protein HY979_00580 [Candidatus Magasanikbacteria bacterium]|nr:hypothetical protein [Candidatus Magasanikbacteria bacterium]
MGTEKREMPSGRENCENLKMALKGTELDANHIKINLDLLNQEITKVGGDIARLGISVEDLTYIDQKLTSKAQLFGTEFPAQQAEQLHSLIEQAEAKENEKPVKEAETALSGGEYSPEVTLQGEISKINSAVAYFNHWLTIYSGNLNTGGSTWVHVDKELTHQLNNLNKLKGSELIAKGKIPEKTEDALLNTLDDVRKMKIRHHRLQQPPNYAQAA